MSVPSAIFLSYAREDAAAAKRIADALRAAGLEVWFDQNELTGGDAWDKKIRTQIAECALFIPLISQTTQARLEGYFRLEWRLAEQRSHLMAKGKRFLVPVCIDDTPEKGAEVPDSFLEVQWTRLPAGEPNASFVDLVRRLLEPSRIGSTPRTPPAPVADVVTAPTPHGARKWLWPLAAAVLLALAATWWLRRATPAVAVTDKSVAVLPFANMSADKDNEHLSDGLTDEIIHALTKVPGLRVPARTSSFVFKGKTEDIKKIGAQLNVAALLQGSVQKAGNKLRVTAQLISVADGYHLWSERYDRDMTDIFAIQDDIARTIASKLRVTFAPGSVKQRTDNIEAYELLLRGRMHYERFSKEDLQRSVAFFEQAIAKQPDYALAHAYLANAWVNFYYRGHISRAEVRPKLRAALENALRLDDTLAEAHISHGMYLIYVERDWAGSERAFKHAIEREPSMARAHSTYSLRLAAEGRLAEALAEGEAAVRLDPLATEGRWGVAWTLLFSRNFERALALSQEMIRATPETYTTHYYASLVLFQMGRLNEAIAAMETARQVSAAPEVLGMLGKYYGRAGRLDDARRVLDELLAAERKGYVPAQAIANCYDGLGEIEACNVWMSKAIDAREGRTVFLKVSVDEKLRANPHFPDWLKKLGLDP